MASFSLNNSMTTTKQGRITPTPIQVAASALDCGELWFKGGGSIARRATSWKPPKSAHPWASAPIFASPRLNALASLLNCSWEILGSLPNKPTAISMIYLKRGIETWRSRIGLIHFFARWNLCLFLYHPHSRFDMFNLACLCVWDRKLVCDSSQTVFYGRSIEFHFIRCPNLSCYDLHHECWCSLAWICLSWEPFSILFAEISPCPYLKDDYSLAVKVFKYFGKGFPDYFLLCWVSLCDCVDDSKVKLV